MDDVYSYRVGGPFDPDRTRWPEGPHLWMDADGLRLVLFLTDPSPREVAAIESGAASFGWTELRYNGFLLFKFGDSPWNDAPFNPQRMTEPFDIDLMPRGEHRTVFTFLVHADTGTIAAMRMFSWPAYFLNYVTESVRRLDARPWGEPEAHAEQRQFYARHPDGPALYRGVVSTLPPMARCTGGQRHDRPGPA